MDSDQEFIEAEVARVMEVMLRLRSEGMPIVFLDAEGNEYDPEDPEWEPEPEEPEVPEYGQHPGAVIHEEP